MMGWRRGLAVAAGFVVAAALAVAYHARGGAVAEAPSDALQVTPPIPAGADDLFVDVTAAAGIDFASRLVDGRMDNIVESAGTGAAFLDYDGDGRLDIFFAQTGYLAGVTSGPPPARLPTDRLFRNLGGGRFADVTEAAGLAHAGYGTGCAVGDYDNDGRPDIYCVRVGANRLYRNLGGPRPPDAERPGGGSGGASDRTGVRFEDVTEKAGVGDKGTGLAATWFDADGDGLLDLYVANYLTFDPNYRLYYGPDNFPGPIAYAAEADVLYRNKGDGTFEDVSVSSGIRAVAPARAMGVVAADFDADGDQDLYVANDMTENFLFLNDGKGRFRDSAMASGTAFGIQGDAAGSMIGVVGDADGDGLPDIWVTNTSYGSLFRNKGASGPDAPPLFDDLVFTSGVGPVNAQYVSWGGGFLDYDLDGDRDLFVVHGDLNRMNGREDVLFENDGTGHFADASRRAGAYFTRKLLGRGGSVADFDNDGAPDVLITNIHDRAVLLRNESRTERGWIEIRLVGRRSNRDGRGARVTVTARGRTQTAWADGAAAYLSQGDPRLLFGLGAANRADAIEVRWPSGQVDRLANVEARRVVTVTEGAGGS